MKFATGSLANSKVSTSLCVLKHQNMPYDVYRPYSEFLYESKVYPKTAFFHSLEKDTESHDMSSAVFA